MPINSKNYAHEIIKTTFLILGYCFLLFQDEMSVQTLIESCIVDDDKLYWCVTSPTMKDKPVSEYAYVSMIVCAIYII